MAITAKIENKDEVGNDFHLFGTITLDNSYPTGGYSLAGILKETDTGAEGVEWIRSIKIELPGYEGRFDRPNQKYVLYQQSAATGALTQVPNATDLSALTNLPYEAWAQ